MKKITILPTIILFFLSSIFSYTAEKTGINVDNKEEEVTLEKSVSGKGEVLKVSLPAKCIVGEQIFCKVSLSNIGKSVIIYGHVSDYRDFILEITDEKGKTIPRTRFGKMVLHDNFGEYRKHVFKKILPGKSLAHKYNLSRLFDLTLVGEYTLTISREFRIGQDKEPSVLKIEAFKFKVSN